MKDIYAAKSKRWYADTLQVTKYDLTLPIPLLIELLKDEFGVIWEGKRTRKLPIHLMIQSLEYPQLEPESAAELPVLTNELTTEAKPVVEVETNLQEMSQPEVIEQPATPIITDYQLQLGSLRQQEDELFKQAIANPQKAQLSEFETVWNKRSEVFTQMENAINPMSTESIQPSKPQELTHCTVEEIQAIPEFDWYQMNLWGKKEWQSESQTYLCRKGIKLPKSVIEQYKLTLRQIAIIQQEITLEGIEEEIGNEDEPCWYDNTYPLSSSLAIDYY